MSGVKRKRNVLNVKQKLEILQKLDNGESASTDAEDVLNEGNTISHSAALQSVETLLDYTGQKGFDYGDIPAVHELIHYKPSLNTSIAANDIITQSKRLASEDKIDAAAANNLMSKSFDKRRNFILIERPFTSFVKEKYPLLFSNAEVKNEVDRIFYVGKYSEFLGNVEKYAPHILSIARDDDPLLLATRHKMDGFKTPAQKK
ncbi:hypothetical protein AVEN_119591-1, partial [Araneus ventricosus]